MWVKHPYAGMDAAQNGVRCIVTNSETRDDGTTIFELTNKTTKGTILIPDNQIDAALSPHPCDGMIIDSPNTTGKECIHLMPNSHLGPLVVVNCVTNEARPIKISEIHHYSTEEKKLLFLQPQEIVVPAAYQRRKQGVQNNPPQTSTSACASGTTGSVHSSSLPHSSRNRAPANRPAVRNTTPLPAAQHSPADRTTRTGPSAAQQNGRTLGASPNAPLRRSPLGAPLPTRDG